MQKLLISLVVLPIALVMVQITDAQQKQQTQTPAKPPQQTEQPIPTQQPTETKQEPEIKLDQIPQLQAEQEPVFDTPIPQTSHVFIIFTDSNPDQLIVLDENGKWLPTVKSVTITMTLGTPATCSCTLWNGFFKPTNPAKKTWPLKQARSVPAAEFQTMIDKLQKDELAVAK